MNRKLPPGTPSKSIIPNSPNRPSPWKLKRDGQVRNRMRRLVEVTALTDLRYRPLLWRRRGYLFSLSKVSKLSSNVNRCR